MENQWRQFSLYLPYVIDCTIYLIDTEQKMLFNANDILESSFQQYNVVTGDYLPVVSMTHYDSSKIKAVSMHVQYVIVKLKEYYDDKYIVYSTYMDSRNDFFNLHKFYIVPK